jgi:hypothetical protein
VVAVTSTRSVPRKGIQPHLKILQISVGERRKPKSRHISGLQICEGGDAEKEAAEDTEDYNGKSVLFQPHHSRHVLRVEVPRQDR